MRCIHIDIDSHHFLPALVLDAVWEYRGAGVARWTRHAVLNAPRSYTILSLSLCIIYWDVIIATEANFRLASLVSKTERDDPSSGDGAAAAAAAAGNQLQRLQLIWGGGGAAVVVGQEKTRQKEQNKKGGKMFLQQFNQKTSHKITRKKRGEGQKMPVGRLR